MTVKPTESWLLVARSLARGRSVLMVPLSPSILSFSLSLPLPLPLISLSLSHPFTSSSLICFPLPLASSLISSLTLYTFLPFLLFSCYLSRRTIGQLVVTRALGDHFMKKNSKGLISAPYVCEDVVMKPDNNAILLIASDGVHFLTFPLSLPFFFLLFFSFFFPPFFNSKVIFALPLRSSSVSSFLSFFSFFSFFTNT